MSGARLRIAVVSPHADDAALSLGATLHALARGGDEITITSCFTESAWAPHLPEPTDVASITRIRAEEDESFARSLGAGARVVALGLRDGPLRWPGRHLFGAAEPGDVAHARELADALRPHLASVDALLVPMGTLHIDHRVARDAALAAWRQRNVAFFEDLPYSAWAGPVATLRAAMALGEAVRRALQPMTLAPPGWRASRSAAAACYSSQLGAPELTPIMNATTAQGGERLWATRGLQRAIAARIPPGT